MLMSAWLFDFKRGGGDVGFERNMPVQFYLAPQLEICHGCVQSVSEALWEGPKASIHSTPTR